MKMRLTWFVVPAFALGLGACKKEAPAEKAGTPAAVEVAPGKGAVPAEETAKPATVIPSATPEQRAEKLGFARYLPKSVETVITVHNGKKTTERAKSLKLWKFIEDEMGEEAAIAEPAEEMADAQVAQDAVADAAVAVDPRQGPAETTQPTDPAAAAPAADAVAADPAAEVVPAVEGFSPTQLLDSEVTLALGDTSGEQIGHLLKFYRRFNYFQIRDTTKALVAQAKGGEAAAAAGGMTNVSPFSEQTIADLLADPEGGASLIEKLSFPPVYMAFRADASQRDQAAQEIASSLGFIGSFGDFAQPVEVEKAGSKFAGYKVLGSKLSEFLTSSRKDMEGNLDAETVDRLIAAVAKRDLVLLTGTIGDYVVLFVGGSTDQFELVTDAKDSLVATDALKFADSYLSKDLGAVAYGEKASIETLVQSASGISDMALGIRDGLAGEDGLGDTREIESLLQVVVEREAALRKFSKTDAFGSVAYFEDGLKIEAFGGTDQGALDWKTPSKLGHLGDSADVVLFADMTIRPEYGKAAHEFLEALAQTGYAIARKTAELPNTPEDLAQFKAGFQLFDEKFRGDAVGLWDAFSDDFEGGLGQERALIVDLKGTVPAIPGLSQEIVDQGRFPRVSLIAPVVDRSKLATAWDKMNKSSTSILAKISEMSGNEIPMQKPMSSEKNNLTTWFFPMPFFNDDFMPSVTVGDAWFVASTSKLQALDLTAKATQGATGTKGVMFKMNFVALQNYSKEMLKVVDANADAIFGEKIEEYRTNKATIEKTIESLDDFDSLSVTSNRDGEVVRTSLHFKTR